MIEVLYVRLIDSHGSDLLSRDESDRYVEVKGETLGYVYATLRVPNGPDSVLLEGAGFGAVRSAADAARLVAALQVAFSRHRVEVVERDYPEATVVVWHAEQQS